MQDLDDKLSVGSSSTKYSYNTNFSNINGDVSKESILISKYYKKILNSTSQIRFFFHFLYFKIYIKNNK